MKAAHAKRLAIAHAAQKTTPRIARVLREVAKAARKGEFIIAVPTFLFSSLDALEIAELKRLGYEVGGCLTQYVQWGNA